MTERRRLALDGKAVKWLDDVPRRPRFRQRRFADAEVVDLSVPAVRVAQDGAGGPASCHHLVLFLAGHGRVRTPEGECRQRPGDVLLLDDANPCEVVHPAGAHLVRWSLPSDLVAPFLPAGLALPAHLGGHMAAVVGDYAQSLTRHLPALGPKAQPQLVAHLAALVGFALTAKNEADLTAPPRHRRVLQERILAHLLAHATDPDLNARRAAADLGISERWLHAVLRDSGNRFGDLVTTHRLRVGHHLLTDPASRHLSIAEIAFLAGFNDLSTFYRQFRRRFRTTPKAMRCGAGERAGGI